MKSMSEREREREIAKKKPWVYFYAFHCSAACQLLFILWFYINFKYVLRENASLLLCISSLCMCFENECSYFYAFNFLFVMLFFYFFFTTFFAHCFAALFLFLTLSSS